MKWPKKIIIIDDSLENAEKLKIDINSSDCIVLSHGHWDHGNGLKYIKNKKLILLITICYNDYLMYIIAF